MAIPYVVTDDLLTSGTQLISEKNLTPSSLDSLPETSREIVKTLRSVFNSVDVISSQKMLSFMREQTRKIDLPVVTLTNTFNDPDFIAGRLSLSRTLQLNSSAPGKAFFKSVGLHPRKKEDAPLEKQYQNLIQDLKGMKDIALADDVLATGGTAVKIIQRLNDEGIRVRSVIANVVLKEAIDRLSSEGVNIIADYKYTKIVDEVCLRDFVAGMPDGGRNVLMQDNTQATAPYLYPFGQVTEWASIPAPQAQRFSERMLSISQDFWRAAEQKNERALDEKSFIKPLSFWPGGSIVEGLELMKKGKMFNACFANIR